MNNLQKAPEQQVDEAAGDNLKSLAAIINDADLFKALYYKIKANMR